MNDDRRDYGGGGGDNRYRGGGGRHHYHNNRRGRGRGRGGGRRRGGFGGGGGRPQQQRGNRFQAERKDPQAEMISNLQSMLTAFHFHDPNRVKNAKMLADLVCGSNAELFLGTNNNSNDPLHNKFSPMVIQLVHCVAVWPTETPLYAALTLLIHDTSQKTLHAGQESSSTSPFAHGCLEYALLLLFRDLDLALLESDREAWGRCRSLLIYLILTSQQQQPTSASGVMVFEEKDASALLVPAAIQQTPLSSITALLQALVIAAQQAETRRLSMAYSLCLMVLDIVPYLPATWSSQQYIVEPIVEILTRSYQSPFEPGLGRHAILLQSAVFEQDDEEEEEDEDEEPESPVCDSLQDALRSLQGHLGSTPAKLALFSDTPWKDMAFTSASDENETPAQSTVEIQIFPTCQSITALLTNTTDISFSKHPSLGIVGRFPVFGSPGADEDDEEEEEAEKTEDMQEEEATPPSVSPRLKSYQENFTSTDRYFLGELIRDVLFTQQTAVSATGVEHGDAKQAAEHIWGVRHMHASDGMEYCILETLLTVLLVHSDRAVYVSRVILELTKLEPNLYSAAILTAVTNIYEDYMPSFTPRSMCAIACWLAFHLTHTDYQWPTAYWKHWETATGSRALFCDRLFVYLGEFVSSNEILVEECVPKECTILASKLTTAETMQDEDSEYVIDLRARMKSHEKPETLLEHVQSSSEGEEPADKKILSLIRAVASSPDEDKDMLTDFTESITMYGSVLTGLAADAETGEVKILQSIEQVVLSRSLLNGMIQSLICTKIISVDAVLSWLLDVDREKPLSQWWDMALLALHLGLECTVVVENENDKAGESLKFFDLLLSSAIRSVATLVEASPEQAQGKRIPLSHIELVEGFKYVICGSETLFLEFCGGPVAALQDQWNESNVAGPRLASLLDVGGSPAIDLLRGILERL